MIKRNIQYRDSVPLSMWKKMAIGTYQYVGDPSTYAMIDFDATLIIKLIEEYQEKGVHLTPTTVFTKGIAMALKEHPNANGMVRLGRFYRRKTVDIFLQTAPDKIGENLSAITVKECDTKSLEEIAVEIAEKSDRVRKEGDPEYRAVKKIMAFIPFFFVKFFVNLNNFILHTLNIWSPLLNVPQDSFGSAMVTSIGMLGIDNGFAPLVPYSRCPIILSVGQISKKAVVENDQIVIKPIITVCGNLDHRLIDGVAAANVLKSFRKYMENPK